jgi:NlpC/P60 family putative phage cell wall peptidase
MTREDLIAEALTWKGTKYHHHQMCKGAGCDCVGFVAGVCMAVGLIPATWQPETYSREWHLHQNQEALLIGMNKLGVREIPLDQAQPGDIITFQYGRVNSHLGILLPRDRIIHANMEVGSVVVTLFTGTFKARARRAFVMPGLT